MGVQKVGRWGVLRPVGVLGVLIVHCEDKPTTTDTQLVQVDIVALVEVEHCAGHIERLQEEVHCVLEHQELANMVRRTFEADSICFGEASCKGSVMVQRLGLVPAGG